MLKLSWNVNEPNVGSFAVIAIGFLTLVSVYAYVHHILSFSSCNLKDCKIGVQYNNQAVTKYKDDD